MAFRRSWPLLAASRDVPLLSFTVPLTLLPFTPPPIHTSPLPLIRSYVDKLLAMAFMPLAAASLAASIGRFEKLGESATIHYTNFRLKLGDMLREQALEQASPQSDLMVGRFALMSDCF